MSKDKNDLTDKEILAMGKKDKPIKKRILFKEYAVKFINLGMANRDAKMIRKELPAIAKRGTEILMKAILKETKIPGKFPKHQQPLISILIYAGVMDEVNGEKRVIYPASSGESIKEV